MSNSSNTLRASDIIKKTELGEYSWESLSTIYSKFEDIKKTDSKDLSKAMLLAMKYIGRFEAQDIAIKKANAEEDIHSYPVEIFDEEESFFTIHNNIYVFMLLAFYSIDEPQKNRYEFHLVASNARLEMNFNNKGLRELARIINTQIIDQKINFF